MKNFKEWLILYFIFYIILLLVKHTDSFEHAALAGLAWALASIETRSL